MAESNQRAVASTLIKPSELGLPPTAVTDVAVANQALEQVLRRPGVKLVGSLTMLTAIPPGYAIALQAVRFEEGHWYSVDGGKFALSARAIELLASASGIESESSERIDDRSKPYACEYRVSVIYTRMDGKRLRIVRSAAVDYSTADTEDSKAAAGAQGNAKMLSRARQFHTRACETKAFARCVRAALGLIGQSGDARGAVYVVPTLVPHVDMTDPEVRRMVAAKALGIVGDVYGSTAAPVLRVFDVDEDPDNLAPEAAVGGSNGSAPIDVTATPKALPAPVEEDPTDWRRQVEEESRLQAAVKARVPPHPDDAKRAAPVERARPAFACSRCGAEIGERLANYSDQTFGLMLCAEHVPADGKRSGS